MRSYYCEKEVNGQNLTIYHLLRAKMFHPSVVYIWRNLKLCLMSLFYAYLCIEVSLPTSHLQQEVRQGMKFSDRQHVAEVDRTQPVMVWKDFLLQIILLAVTCNHSFDKRFWTANNVVFCRPCNRQKHLGTANPVLLVFNSLLIFNKTWLVAKRY